VPSYQDPDIEDDFARSPPALTALRQDIPLGRAWAAWETLASAIDQGDEKAILESVQELKKTLPAAASRATCLTGIPHVEGLYTFGDDRTRHITAKSKRAVLEYEQALRVARSKAKLAQGKL